MPKTVVQALRTRVALALGTLVSVVFLHAGAAAAQSAVEMVDTCTRAGQSYFRDFRSSVDARYAGVRIAGAHLVNGRIFLPNRTENFTCTFSPNGRQMILFFAEGRLQPGFVPSPPPQPPAVPVPPASGPLVQVRGLAPNDVLNVRTGPGTAFQVIGALANGTTVRRLGCRSVGTAQWCEIHQLTDMRERGWVNGRYLGAPGAAPTPPAGQLPERPGAGVTVQVTGLGPGGRLNLRSGPGTTYAITGTLSNGTSLRRLSCQSIAGDRWCQVELLTANRERGWVSGRYLSEGVASQLHQSPRAACSQVSEALGELRGSTGKCRSRTIVSCSHRSGKSSAASRAGLRPPPTCPTRQGGRPSGDVADPATNGCSPIQIATAMPSEGGHPCCRDEIFCGAPRRSP
jgi:uncharacterized protein YraI